jgi:regulatory factor X
MSHVGPNQHLFNNPEDMLMRFGHQLSTHPNPTGMDQSMQESHAVMPRAEDFQNHSMHAHNLSQHSIPPEIPSGLPNVTAQYQHMYDSGVENHVPEHLVEEPEISEPGKKKRGASSTIANDNELRKLLRQYENWNLKQMAAEVMKHEGGGGKAEKVKQVFAMIW